MLNAYPKAGERLAAPGRLIDASTAWIDLLEPTAEEEARVEAAIGIEVPTRAETREIEASSRLYRENGAHYMTAYVLFNQDADAPEGATATFILTRDQLVTVRYHEPRAFPLFAARAINGHAPCASAPLVLISLLETIAARAADVIERTQDRVEDTARRIFAVNQDSRAYNRGLDETLREVGLQGNLTARLEESLFSLNRLLAFLVTALKERGEPSSVIAQAKTVQRDVRSLAEQLHFLSERIMFLLDATLGAISIEQNKTMKVFSLVAASLMPPTLIAAIYGMNFKHMPELEWTSGYPLALVAIVMAAVAPVLYFRNKGWL
jgi:magnesium transporter